MTSKIQEIQPIKNSITLIWSLKVIQIKGHEVNWKTIYDLPYVFHRNLCYNMHHSEDTAH